MAVSRCRCGERMRASSSRRAGEYQIRYVACPRCHERRREVVKAEEIWRRKRDR